VTTIENAAFEACFALTSITIPESVEYIGCNAFLKCTALTSISIPESVAWLMSGTFEDCTNLTTVTIHSLLSYDYDKVFKGCKKLTSVIVKEYAMSAIIRDVIDMIDAIDVVEYTEECKGKIDAARSAYEDLSAKQKTYVINYAVLTDAETKYVWLEKMATGIVDVNARDGKKNGKYLMNGRIVIIKSGKKFSINGQVE
jgi:hypothetical protein